MPPAGPGAAPPAGTPPTLPPHPLPPALTGLRVSPATFAPAKRGPAVTRRGGTGTSLRFRLSRPAKVEFRVMGPHREIGRFSVRGRRGANRLRFTGRLRGRSLPPGPYRLMAQATDGDGLTSSAASTAFRVR
jgi:hypothetical protein